MLEPRRLAGVGRGNRVEVTHGVNVLLGFVVLLLGVLAAVQWNVSYGVVLVLIGLIQSGLGSWLYRRRGHHER
jgi:hypothetical protein